MVGGAMGIEDLPREPLQQVLTVAVDVVTPQLQRDAGKLVVHLLLGVVRPPDQTDVVSLDVRPAVLLDVLLTHVHDFLLLVPRRGLADVLRRGQDRLCEFLQRRHLRR